jgi:hypothetical protein
LKFSNNNNRSEWAVKCRVIKICNSKSMNPIDVNISDNEVNKYNELYLSNNISNKTDRSEITETNRINNKLLESVIDSNNFHMKLFSKMDTLLEKITHIEKRLFIIETFLVDLSSK